MKDVSRRTIISQLTIFNYSEHFVDLHFIYIFWKSFILIEYSIDKWNKQYVPTFNQTNLKVELLLPEFAKNHKIWVASMSNLQWVKIGEKSKKALQFH